MTGFGSRSPSYPFTAQITYRRIFLLDCKLKPSSILSAEEWTMACHQSRRRYICGLLCSLDISLHMEGNATYARKTEANILQTQHHAFRRPRRQAGVHAFVITSRAVWSHLRNYCRVEQSNKANRRIDVDDSE